MPTFSLAGLVSDASNNYNMLLAYLLEVWSIGFSNMLPPIALMILKHISITDMFLFHLGMLIRPSVKIVHKCSRERRETVKGKATRTFPVSKVDAKVGLLEQWI